MAWWAGGSTYRRRCRRGNGALPTRTSAPPSHRRPVHATAVPVARREGRAWGQQEWPSRYTNYAPAWELCHIILYQLNVDNIDKPVCTEGPS